MYLCIVKLLHSFHFAKKPLRLQAVAVFFIFLKTDKYHFLFYVTVVYL